MKFDKVSVQVIGDVWIEPSRVKLSLQAHIYNKLQIPFDAYIDAQGRLCRDEELYTSHSWTETKIINEAPSEEIVEVIKAFKVINKHVRG